MKIYPLFLSVLISLALVPSMSFAETEMMDDASIESSKDDVKKAEVEKPIKKVKRKYTKAKKKAKKNRKRLAKKKKNKKKNKNKKQAM